MDTPKLTVLSSGYGTSGISKPAGVVCGVVAYRMCLCWARFSLYDKRNQALLLKCVCR